MLLYKIVTNNCFIELAETLLSKYEYDDVIRSRFRIQISKQISASRRSREQVTGLYIKLFRYISNPKILNVEFL